MVGAATRKARNTVTVLTRLGTMSKLELDERSVLTGWYEMSYIETLHNVTQFTIKHSSYKNATTGYLIVWLTCLNVTLAPSPIPSRITHSLFGIIVSLGGMQFCVLPRILYDSSHSRVFQLLHWAYPALLQWLLAQQCVHSIFTIIRHDIVKWACPACDPKQWVRSVLVSGFVLLCTMLNRHQACSLSHISSSVPV